jgi:hypothetical protein
MYYALLLRRRKARLPLVAVEPFPYPVVLPNRVAYAVRVFLVAAIALATAGCSERGREDRGSIERNAQNSPRSDEAKKIGIQEDAGWPEKSSADDRALMSRWLAENELCRGSSDEVTIRSMCAKRERTGIVLERRGWCYAYEDDTVFPVDYRWHSCAEKTLSPDRRTQHLDGLALRDADETPANDRNFDPRDQRVEDARAAVRESWAVSGKTIETMMIGYKCNVIDQLSANMAVQTVQLRMQDELWRAGVVPDASSGGEIEQITANAIASGKSAAENGACARMTPASRGRLRALLAALI